MAKCGTSALHYYLDLHPQISMSRPKELNFFSGPNWTRGLEWYAAHFDPSMPVRGESSPSYTAPRSRKAPVRIASALPGVKLVLMVRDPIERAVSTYHHRRAEGRERRKLGDALADPQSVYIQSSRYGAVLERYLCHFPLADILVLSQEDLLVHRTETMREAYRFVGVDSSFRSPRFQRERNRSKAKGGRHEIVRRLEATRLGRAGYRLPDEAKWAIERLASRGRRKSEQDAVIDSGLRQRLVAMLAADAARLRELTGKSFPSWSV